MTAISQEARNVVEGIIDNLNDRRGYDLGELDEEVQEEIRDTWATIVQSHLGGSPKHLPPDHKPPGTPGDTRPGTP